MMKKKNWVIWTVLIVVLLSIAVPSFFVLKDPVLSGTFKTLAESLFHSGEPNWNTYTSPDGKISLDSPFKISWKNEDHLKKGKGFQFLKGKAQPNRSEFTVFIDRTRYINLDICPNDSRMFLESVAEVSKDDPKHSWSSAAITCSGMPATLIIDSFDSVLGPFNSLSFQNHMSTLVLENKKESWLIMTGSSGRNISLKNDWEKRVIQSIKIQPDNQSTPSK